MEKKDSNNQELATFLLCLGFFLDLVTLGFCFAAKMELPKGAFQIDSSSVYQWCYYSSDLAIRLAAGALLYLLTSVVLGTAACRSLSRGKPLKPGATAIIFFIIKWVSSIVAGACLGVAIVQNAAHIRYFSYFGTIDPSCEKVGGEALYAAMGFTFLSFISSVFCYLYTKVREEAVDNTTLNVPFIVVAKC